MARVPMRSRPPRGRRARRISGGWYADHEGMYGSAGTALLLFAASTTARRGATRPVPVDRSGRGTPGSDTSRGPASLREGTIPARSGNRRRRPRAATHRNQRIRSVIPLKSRLPSSGTKAGSQAWNAACQVGRWPFHAAYSSGCPCMLCRVDKMSFHSLIVDEDISEHSAWAHSEPPSLPSWL